jgi:hypothetical protein
MKTQTDNATPRPWSIQDGKICGGPLTKSGLFPSFIAETTSLPNSKANASLIVRAVNSHDELVQMAKEMLRYMQQQEVWGDYERWKKTISKAEGKGE